MRDGDHVVCLLYKGLLRKFSVKLINSGVILHNMFYSVLGSHVQEQIQDNKEVIRTPTEAVHRTWTDNTMTSIDLQNTTEKI